MQLAENSTSSLKSDIRRRYGSATQRLVGEYERTLHKEARWKNHHVFSMRCRDEGAVPDSLRIKPPVKTREGYRIAERAGRAFLSARINLPFGKGMLMIFGAL